MATPNASLAVCKVCQVPPFWTSNSVHLMSYHPSISQPLENKLFFFYHPQGNALHYFSHQSVPKCHSNLPLIQHRIQNARLLGVLGVQNVISTQHWEHGIWKQGLCRCNQIKMRSYWIRVGPHPMTAIPPNKREIWTDTHRGKDWSYAAARTSGIASI